MKFARLGAPGAEIPVLVEGDRYLDLRAVTSDVNGDFLAGDFRRTRRRRPRRRRAPGARRCRRPAHRRADRPPERRHLHRHELRRARAPSPAREPPTVPIIFLKTPNTVVGPNDAVTIPRGSEKTDWEVELGIVIGARAAYLDSPDEADAHIAGYVVANDVSERAFQMEVSGGQWSKGKIAPGLQPDRPVAGHPRRGRPSTTCGCAAGSTASRGRTRTRPT